MILSRRQAHFYMISGLCCIVPFVAIAALIWRPIVPFSDADALFTAAKFPGSDQSLTGSEPESLSIKNLLVLARTVKRSEDQIYLELHPQKAIEFSDTLVYWLPAEAKTDVIDNTAVLLGQLSGTSRRQFPLPSGSINTSGQLFFYSQGQQQTVAVVPFQASLPPE